MESGKEIRRKRGREGRGGGGGERRREGGRERGRREERERVNFISQLPSYVSAQLWIWGNLFSYEMRKVEIP